ncbi:hypothetical protein LXA43DRAFT_1113818 [Ganoderma leucocontextum]|nr:hypothetical protein LXA43DRAFT_1113818 [Ganoderma leucocontextum]
MGPPSSTPFFAARLELDPSLLSSRMRDLAVHVFGATYSTSDSHVGTDFLSAFTHQAISAKSNRGLKEPDLREQGLRADDTTILSASDPGRDSVRLQSKKPYAEHVTV